MRKSLDYVSGFSRMSQCSRNSTHGFSGTSVRGEYYDPTGRPPFLRAYVNFMNKHCTSWTYNAIRVQEEGSTVCGHHCIFYLIHRCAGTFNLLGSLFLAYTPLKTFLVVGCVFSTWSISKVFI
jgi:hypothetical protein